MKLIVIIVFVILNGLTGSAQVKDSVPYQRFNIEAGIRIPMGKLKEKIGTSPEFGFWYRTRIEHNDMLDIGFTIYVPQDKRRFDYVAPDSIYRLKAEGISGTVGFRFGKIYSLGGKHDNKIEWLSTFGWAFFTYHDTPAELQHERNPEPTPRQNNEIRISTYTKSFNTFNIGQGLRYSIGDFGLQAAYNYSPYGIFSDHVPKDFGSHSLSFGILYKI